MPAQEKSAPPGDRLTFAYSSLKERILSLDLLPGEVVSERDLEALLGVSRSPIREALARLELDGLVIRQKRGYRIAPIDIDELMEVFEYRESVESSAARHACRRARDEELEALRALLDSPLDESNTDQWYEASTDFHVRVAQLSGNRFLVSALKDTLTRIARVRWMHSRNADRRIRGLKAHQTIMPALLARNADAAAEAMAAHVREVRDDLVEFLRASELTLRGRGVRIF